MKLSSLLGLVALGSGQESSGFTGQLSVEDGGTLKDGCGEADKWELSKLGNDAEVELLEPFTAESPTDRYELTNNELKIMANKKDRSMMGIVTCKKNDVTLSTFQVTGKPVFGNLANSLTNLDGDKSKRMDCAVSGYPLPTLSWRFQAIDKEEAEIQCEGGICSPCIEGDSCDAGFCTEKYPNKEDAAAKEDCVANFYSNNSTDLFKITSISKNLQIRYSINEANSCPMTSDEIGDEFSEKCKIVQSDVEVNALEESYKSRSQLYFPNVTYSQRGKYICVASQTLSDSKTTERTKVFIWRVKDPIAALWPFLALVSEVMIVVCIILYYEKASASKNVEGNDEEGGEFLSKKEENQKTYKID